MNESCIIASRPHACWWPGLSSATPSHLINSPPFRPSSILFPSPSSHPPIVVLVLVRSSFPILLLSSHHPSSIIHHPPSAIHLGPMPIPTDHLPSTTLHHHHRYRRPLHLTSAPSRTSRGTRPSPPSRHPSRGFRRAGGRIRTVKEEDVSLDLDSSEVNWIGRKKKRVRCSGRDHKR
jgi:hypothetical protein